MKIGILGAGGIAQKMADTLNRMEDAECYAVASRDEKKAKDFAEEYGIEKAYGSYLELAEDDAVELIYIATPHSHHFEHAKLCVEHGKPVLCEKAFMANAKQTKEIFELAEKHQVFITEAIWTRYMPSRTILEELIQSGSIGEVTAASANLGYVIMDVPRLREPELAGGALLDVGVYPLNFLSMVLGDEVEAVTSSCIKSDTGVDAQNAIILTYKGGRLGTAQSGALAATEQNGIVYGTKGYIIAENINNIDKIKVYTTDRKLKKEVVIPEQITGFEYEVRASIQAIREGRRSCPEMPHEEILRIMELMDSLRRDWNICYPFEV